ncbi:hypothetical protein B4U79_16119 [Dinothrombium tinctorium]|uniref:Acetylserotonin O-methyltransferase n=1 Tax=Dinothrombium tinctorium TaxID=1965070 RepID=A0A3S3S0Z6_9ACAR|nr:hypothetical protein B4U79_16119 [Dinothrombium tinctorium]
MREEQELAYQMHDFCIEFFISNALFVATKLNIADYLAIKPMTADDLAILTQSNSRSLYRLLRALASIEIFEEDHFKRFHLTPKANLLRESIPYGMKRSTIMFDGDEYTLWGKLMQALETGEQVSETLYGVPFWKHLKHNENDFQNMRLSLKEHSIAFCSHIPQVYDFNQFEHIIDVGCNDGTFMAFILANAMSAKGTLFDEPHVIEEAKKHLAMCEKSIRERCSFEAGNFLEAVPAGGDCYTLKSALVDWNEEDGVKIISNIRKQMKPGCKLLIIQSVLPELNKPHLGTQIDLLYLLCDNGKERTEEEFKNILTKAGLKFSKIIQTGYPLFDIVEAFL